MSNIITVGYLTEGSTDERFLKVIIEKTFMEIAFNCESMIEVFEPVLISPIKANTFVEKAKQGAKDAFDRGMLVLCIHLDSDNASDDNVFNYKISPAIKAIEKEVESICKNIVALVPIYMSEAWMLADKDLLKSEIGTTLTDKELGINVHPESVTNPKALITEALRIAQGHFPKKINKIKISELYQPIGQNLSIERLDTLNSFKKFKEAVRSAFIKLNYLHGNP